MINVKTKLLEIKNKKIRIIHILRIRLEEAKEKIGD